ncbi:unnamed protein product, partial [marine sediment metagenome]
MRTYIIRRLLVFIPVLLLMTVMIFLVVHLMPSDIVAAIQAAGTDEELDRAAIEQSLGLDAPMIVQYGRWMGFIPQMDGSVSGIFQGDLGDSWWYGVPEGRIQA